MFTLINFVGQTTERQGLAENSPRIANTETKRQATLRAKGKSVESPKGLGRDGNKPLMRNRTALRALPDRHLPATFYELESAQCRRHNAQRLAGY